MDIIRRKLEHLHAMVGRSKFATKCFYNSKNLSEYSLDKLCEETKMNPYVLFCPYRFDTSHRIVRIRKCISSRYSKMCDEIEFVFGKRPRLKDWQASGVFTKHQFEVLRGTKPGSVKTYDQIADIIGVPTYHMLDPFNMSFNREIGERIKRWLSGR